MANLVRPINKLPPVVDQIIEFKGLDRRAVVPDGSMADMLNLTSDNYPILSVRKPRGDVAMPGGAVRPIQIMAKHGKNCLLAADSEDTVNFYYNDNKVNAVTGLTPASYMVAINNRVCFFPQKTYIELFRSGDNVTIGQFGSLESSVFVNEKAVDISSGTSAKITMSAGHGFGYDDALNITGTLAYTQNGSAKTMQCNVSCIVESVENTNTLVLPYATFIEMIGEGATGITLTGTVSRTMPDLDFVIEWNNRLWGVSNADNTIYACKLGDPKNWQYFQGTSLDSYYAQQGTDGLWTAVGEYSNHIIFFKEDSMARVYGSSPSSFQITNAKCFGVESNSSKSVVTINDVVFYKSKIGIMAYYGNSPVCISDNFNEKSRNAVAGTEGRKYYVSLQRESGGYELLVYDTDLKVWHKEDNTRMRSTSMIKNTLYYIEYDSDVLVCDAPEAICSKWLLCCGGVLSGDIKTIGSDKTTEEFGSLEWMAEFGPFDEYYENKKIYSRISLRLMPRKDISGTGLGNEDNEVLTTEDDISIGIDRWLKVYISLDEGEWELVQTYEPPEIGGEIIPIIPRRCDRYSIRLEGRGECSIKSLSRRFRAGTFGKL